MARYRHPSTVGLPLADWPQADQEAWSDAVRDDDVLLGAGRAAHLRPATRVTVMKAYGQYLRFVREHKPELIDAPSAERLNKEVLRRFIEALRTRISINSVLPLLGHLSRAFEVMSPSTDRTLLKLAHARLMRLEVPARKAGEPLVSPVALIALGNELMSTWQDRAAHDRRLNAMDYRDGLMIAFLALCPVRVANLAQMRLGQHLTIDGNAVRVQFTANETKGRRALEFDWPAELTVALTYYLRSVHPILHPSTDAGAPLWPSLHKLKVQMSAHGIYTRIVQITTRRLGQAVTPHVFRDAAATFIAEMTPQRALMAAAVLQHTTFETTRKHYIRGRQHQAMHSYHGAIDDLIAEVEAEHLQLFGT